MKDGKSRTHVAGKGGDGNEYGVTRMTGSGSRTRRPKPCPTCPWRKDAQIGRFPADAYRSSASTAYDTSMTVFSCHESGSNRPAVCAGFLLANSHHNMAVRLAAMNGKPYDAANPDEVELHESYRAMAIANGVDPGDSRIAPCRADDEDGFEVAARIRAAGMDAACGPENLIRRLTDEDHDEMMKGNEMNDTTTMNPPAKAQRQLTDIEWDTDGETVELPVTIDIPDNIHDDDAVDYASDEYGWCIRSSKIIGSEHD